LSNFAKHKDWNYSEIKHIVVYATITQEQVLKGSMKTCSYSIR
jgi:hypothetical protein